MLQIPAKVNNFEDALAAIRYCDKMCTLISVQAHTIKNINFLKVSLIEHAFIHVRYKFSLLLFQLLTIH